MANNTITVFEHTRLYVGEQGFEKRHLDALAKYNDLHGGKYFTLGYDKITFKSYVGAIQAGDKIIEILPKADNFPIEQGSRAKWQPALLFMLKQAGYIKLNETEKAEQKSSQSNLLDIYLYTFLDEVQKLVHGGLVKKYRRTQCNKTVLKGRLIVSKQIQYNIVHKERSFTEHNVYDRNNSYNGILKRALEVVMWTCTNYSIKHESAKQQLFFEGIDSVMWESDDFDKLIFDRKTKHYAYAIELARMIILNYCPDMTAGNKPILAILFDMNKLFEKFVYKTLKKQEEHFKDYSLSISPQVSKLFWREKTLRPDILVSFRTKSSDDISQYTHVVVDTKWKVNSSENPSDEDLRQMYAYNLQFGAQRSVLLYPSIGQRNIGIANYADISMTSQFVHGCELYFSELFDEGEDMMSDSFAKYFLESIILGNKG